MSTIGYASAFEEVLITEIDYDGYTVWEDDTDTNSNDEFIELYNTGSSDIDLSGWELRIISSSGKKTVPLVGIISSKQYLVVRRVTKSQESSLIPKSGFYNTSLLSLVNSGAYLEIRDSNGDTVSSVNMYSSWEKTLSTNHSIQRNPGDLLWESDVSTPGVMFVKTPPPIQVYGGLSITELLPDPLGDDGLGEFVEIYNETDKDIDLAGWTLDDIENGGSSPQILVSQIIPAQSYGVVKKPELKISLNNYSTNTNLYDEVILRDPNLMEQSRIKYWLSEVQENWSYQRIGDVWSWSNLLSPGSINQVTSPPEPNSPNAPVVTTPEVKKSYPTGSMIISEIYPYPISGEAEFIEIYNTTDQEINLQGWILEDGAKKSILSDTTILPKSYYVLNQAQSLIYLNNTNESLKLYDPEGTLQSELSYPKGYQGKSYSYFSFGWSWSTILTPGKVNIFEDIISSSENNTIDISNIRDLERLDDGDQISIEGYVFIPPGIISPTIWYLEKNSEIIKVSNRGKRFQELLTSQQKVALVAEWHASDTQMYLTMNKNSNVSAIDTDALSTIQPTSTLDSWGNLLKITGKVIAKKGDTIELLMKNNQELPVRLYGEAKGVKNIKKDMIITVTGITERYEGETRLIVWEISQIQPVTISLASTTAEVNTLGFNNENIDRGNSLSNTRSDDIRYAYQDMSGFDINQVFELSDSNYSLWQISLIGLWSKIQEYPWFSVAIVLNAIWWIYRVWRWAMIFEY